ncbi:hypothetical protein DL96DRAFT_1611951 [Flagelloscypha sp. PMI_526]|nr:hypothetical protein DL96DRAFT_1611951 [Flagelloscypha sp. PMI_526]
MTFFNPFHKAVKADGSSSHPQKALPCDPDILIDVAQRLCIRDKISLRLANRAMHNVCANEMYRDISGVSLEQCFKVLNHLKENPDTLCLVQRLTLRPSLLPTFGKTTVDGELQLGLTLRKLAPRLTGLKSFFWDGAELLQPDDIWKDLREASPLLRSIRTTIGTIPFKEGSELFKFQDLLEFEIVSKSEGLGMRRLFFSSLDVFDTFPTALIDMLKDRCPDLEKLDLGGYGRRIQQRCFDIRPFLDARWPHLNSLSFGTIVSSKLLEPNNEPFCDFLEGHDKLRTVNFWTPSVRPLPRTLPITAFTGNCMQLSRQHLSNIKELNLAVQPIESLILRSVISHLTTYSTQLEKLALWIDVEPVPIEDQLTDIPGYVAMTAEEQTDHVTLLERLLTGLPTGVLKSFSLTCSSRTKHTFDLIEISNLLSQYPSLRDVHLGKVHKLGEEDCRITASRLATSLPNLDTVSVWHFARPFDDWRKQPLVREYGIYDVIRQRDASPLRLNGRELRMGLKTPTKKLILHDLRPKTPSKWDRIVARNKSR